MVSRNGLPSAKELSILEQLMGGREKYGLELVRDSAGALRKGTIYVLLDRLEDQKFIVSRTQKDPLASGMPRRLYEITGLGQRALNAARDVGIALGGGFAAAGG